MFKRHIQSEFWATHRETDFVPVLQFFRVSFQKTISLKSPLRYNLAVFKDWVSMASDSFPSPSSLSWHTKDSRSSKARAPSAAKYSSHWRDLRTEALHSASIRNMVRSLKGSNPVSSQYCSYWPAILCGISVRMTFGISIVFPEESVSMFCPNGRSWTKWGLVMKDRKWSNCCRSTLTLTNGW